MQIFIKKIIIFIGLFLGISTLVALGTGQLALNKLSKKGRGVVIDKNNRLDSIAKNKIVLIGGSNVCYGINSQMIEDSFNMPVVDMAINAGMGMSFYYQQVKHAIKAGDIIIGIPEYYTYDGKITNGDAGIYSLAIIDYRNIKFFNAMQWLQLPIYLGDIINENVKAFFTYEKNKMTFGRFQYNKWGDYMGHKNEGSYADTFKHNKQYDLSVYENKNEIYPDKNFINLIKSFEQFCNSKNAIYLHAYPVYSRYFYNDNVAKKIAEKLQPLKFINNPETYLYGFDSLYDSPNHILYKFRDERTSKLINDIRVALHQIKHE